MLGRYNLGVSREGRMQVVKFSPVEIRLKNGELLLIREGTADDAAQVIAYIEGIAGESDFLTFGPGEFGLTVEGERSYLAGISARGNALYLVAVIDGEIVGTLSFAGGGRPRTAHTGEFGVSVRRSHWGNGIGRELIRCLLNWCKESGRIRKVNLRVRTDNLRAINLYKQMGFQEEGRITRDFQVDGVFYDSLTMGYPID